MYVSPNIEELSCNHCYSGKAMSITYCEGVFVSSLQYSCAVLPSVAYQAQQYFSTLSHKRHNFRKKEKCNEHEMCVLMFSINFAGNISHSTKK